MKEFDLFLNSGSLCSLEKSVYFFNIICTLLWSCHITTYNSTPRDHKNHRLLSFGIMAPYMTSERNKFHLSTIWKSHHFITYKPSPKDHTISTLKFQPMRRFPPIVTQALLLLNGLSSVTRYVSVKTTSEASFFMCSVPDKILSFSKEALRLVTHVFTLDFRYNILCHRYIFVVKKTISNFDNDAFSL